MIDLKLERSLTLAHDMEVVIKSWNSRQNSAFAQQARASGQGSAQGSGETPLRYVFVQPNLTPDEALKFAQQRLAELIRHERTIQISMPGDLSLSPRSMIALEGTGTEFDQLYYVDVIERRLRQNGGFTQFVMAKNSSPRTETTMSSASSGNTI